ncbi:MAG TPA: 2-amino-4-hydroxy-6-hydroxymethyldihydropteridine diphosphokinase [Longimicrobium sp.]|jgi:2-amino-4-hydroxy-6-hydroxymethyldihydropteridine diphosphokinase
MAADVAARAIVGLGANLGDAPGQLRAALRSLARYGRVVRLSSLYRTEPVGGPPQPDFSNAVCVVEAAGTAHELLRRLQGVELELGRVRAERYGPRTIDLDLLDFAGEVRNDRELVLPHPELERRAFVLVPLAEAAPEWRHPVLHRTALELLAALPEAHRVRRIGPLLPGGPGVPDG